MNVMRDVTKRMSDGELSVALQEAVHDHVVGVHSHNAFYTCVVEEAVSRLASTEEESCD